MELLQSLHGISMKIKELSEVTFQSFRWELREVTLLHHLLLRPLLLINFQGDAHRLLVHIDVIHYLHGSVLLQILGNILVRFLLQQLRSQPGTPVDGGSPRREEGVQVRQS